MVFHIAVCSPDAALRSGLERQCMEYFARRQDACIVQQLPDADALLRRDTEGERFDLYLIELGAVAAPAGLSAAAELRRRGWPVLKADNRVGDGIRRVGELLKDGSLLFADTCRHTAEEFQSYVWDAAAADRGEDRPVKEHDHCMDAIRYFVATVIDRGRGRVMRRPRGL